MRQDRDWLHFLLFSQFQRMEGEDVELKSQVSNHGLSFLWPSFIQETSSSPPRFHFMRIKNVPNTQEITRVWELCASPWGQRLVYIFHCLTYTYQWAWSSQQPFEGQGWSIPVWQRRKWRLSLVSLNKWQCGSCSKCRMFLARLIPR